MTDYILKKPNKALIETFRENYRNLNFIHQKTSLDIFGKTKPWTFTDHLKRLFGKYIRKETHEISWMVTEYYTEEPNLNQMDKIREIHDELLKINPNVQFSSGGDNP